MQKQSCPLVGSGVQIPSPAFFTMKEATLCIVVDSSSKKVLLGYKKRGFGQGKWNGFGGKIEEKEELFDAAMRELYEESSITASHNHLDKVAELAFRFPSKPEWDQVVHVFTVHCWEGTPQESEEMKPEWFSFSEIPFKEMWNDDKHWLPLILQGKKLKAAFVFQEDNETILDYSIQEDP